MAGPDDSEALLRVHSKDLHEHIAQEVGECLESGLYTDLMIRCNNGQTLHGHKLVLSAVSPYLKWLLENNDWEELQTLELPDANVEEVQLLLEVVYNGSVEATIEELRNLILLAHRLYITIPMSDELMQGLDVTLPPIPPFKPPLKVPQIDLSGLSPLPNLKPRPNQSKKPMNPLMRDRSFGIQRPMPPLSQQNGASPFTKKLDPQLMTAVLANSQNSEHICPICNAKYNNVGNFKQHMKSHDTEQFREQRNAILSEMIATSYNPQTSLYNCHVCKSNYNHSGNFKQHLLKHERESGSISATLVAQAGQNPHLTSVLQSAMTDRVDKCDREFEEKKNQYRCEHCGRTFKHPGNFKQHLSSHMKSTTQQPPNSVMANLAQMNNVFASQSGKKRPSASPHNTSGPTSGSNSPKSMKLDGGNVLPLMLPVACPECHLDFPGVEALQAHISVTHKHLDVELPRDLQATFSERAKSVLQQNFKCELCQQGFKTEAFLNQHKMSFHKNELLSDGASSSNGTTVVGLSMAQQLASERSFGASHVGGASFMKSYDCRFCGKQFSKMSKLTQHMKIHSNPEDHYKYPCDICGKKFTRPQHVNRHKLLHTGERPFKCNKCEKAFSREDRLKQHKLKGCDNDPPVVSNYQNPLMISAARSNNREIPSPSNENQWIIEHPSTDNDNGENGLEENGENEEEQNFYIDEDGDNEESMVVDASIVGEDEESLEEVSAEPIYSNPNSDDEDDGGEAEQSRDQEDLEEIEEEEEES